MEIESATLEPIDGPLPTDWVLRVVIRGTDLDERALPMAAEIGGQRVQGLMPGAEEGVVLGFLTAAPAAGSELRIGHADQPLIGTGITFEAGQPGVV